MKKQILALGIFSVVLSGAVNAQEEDKKEKEGYKFEMVKSLECSPMENQQRAGTCWSYSAMGMVEAEMIRLGKEFVDLSEQYVVRKSYEEKAINYVRMHGNYNFGGGGAVNDVFNVIKNYGMLPESVYEGLNYGTDVHTHGELDIVLKNYLDGVIENKNRKLTTAWFEGYKGILDAYLGKIPESFEHNGKTYTARSFADEVVGINPDDYVFLTSYSHHPFYGQFVLEVPDNWTWSLFYNLPIDDLMATFDNSIEKGYSLVWASDISEKGFASSKGLAVVPETNIEEMDGSERLKWEKMSKKERNKLMYSFDVPGQEKTITQEMRQEAFDNYETTDDHGMLMAGIAKDQNGTKYYYIKNSWGEYNDLKGYFYASEAFVRYKTMSVGVHKDALSKDLKKKLGIK
jgi:bleomycin hydrolase